MGSHSRFSPVVAALALVFMLAFPKAGFYYRNIPITFGYVVLGFLAALELVYKAKNRQRSAEPVIMLLLVMLFGLGVVELGSFRVYGMKSMGVGISIVVSSVLIPVLAILATQWVLRSLGVERFIKCLRWALAIVFAYGVISFFAYNLFGKVVGVPYLTTTGSDLSQIFSRHNLRGGVVKMFSTYNNGNILGINVLMWGPIAAVGVSSSWLSGAVFRSICLLTLSRSVWAGMIAYEIFNALMKRSVRRIFVAGAAVLGLLTLTILVSWLIGKDPIAFLLDKDLGGRMSNLQNDLEVISQRRIGWDSESVYAAAYLAFGPLGAVMLTAIWTIPVWAGGKTPLQQTARLACVIYLLVSIIEGAFVLVPTQATYWMIATIALCQPELTVAHADAASLYEDESPTPTRSVRSKLVVGPAV